LKANTAGGCDSYAKTRLIKLIGLGQKVTYPSVEKQILFNVKKEESSLFHSNDTR
jgi:hypothetical protein